MCCSRKHPFHMALRATQLATYMVLVLAAGSNIAGAAQLRLAMQGAPVVYGSYPNKPIRLVIPFAPGGSADIVTRVIGEKLSEGMRQQVIVDNRPGAGGNIGTEIAAKASPDGYTILMVATAHAVNPSLYRRLPFDLTQDFTPITLIASVPNVLLLYPGVPAKTVKELIGYARSASEQLNFGSAGNGSASHLTAELFKSMAGIPLVHVPYKGSPQAVVDVLAGRIAMIFQGLPAAMPHVKAAKLRALAVTGAKRTATLPDIPTIGETLPGYQADGWYGLMAPAGISPRLVAELNNRVVAVARMSDVRERLLAVGAEALTSSPREFATHLKSELAKWSKVVRESGVVVQ